LPNIDFDLIKLLDDEPCKVDPNEPLDHLGMEATAKVVAGIVAGTNGPFTIGLYGDWGSGKTTVLHRASQHCDFLKNTIVLHLNPWEHEREPNAVQSLLQELIYAIDQERDKPKFSVVEQAALQLRVLANRASRWPAKPMAWMAYLTAFFAQQPETAAVMTALGESMRDDGAATSYSDAEEWRSARKNLETAVPDGKKVVVFLDDMDRCQAHRALDVLEALKHLLWVPGFVFVLALDVKAVTSYLAKAYEATYNEQAKEMASRFLEKLVQAQVPISHRDTSTFLKFCEAKVNEAIEGNKHWIPYEVESGAVPQLLAAAAHRVPRQVKRLINNVVLDWAAFKAREGKLLADDAAGLALSRVVYDLTWSTEGTLLDDGEHVSMYERFVLHSDADHLALAKALESQGNPKGSGRDGDEAQGSLPYGGSSGARSLPARSGQ